MIASPPSTAPVIRFYGHWEVVRDRHDGRFLGASARSFHPGDAIVVHAPGRGLRVYGLTGPTGGRARITIDHVSAGTIDFYSRERRIHVPLFGTHLRAGMHDATIVVLATHDRRSRDHYVNVDLVEVIR